jgi:hypothetical protein
MLVKVAIILSTNRAELLESSTCVCAAVCVGH